MRAAPRAGAGARTLTRGGRGDGVSNNTASTADDDLRWRVARGIFLLDRRTRHETRRCLSPRKRCLPFAEGRATSSRRTLVAHRARQERRVHRALHPDRWFRGRATEKGVSHPAAVAISLSRLTRNVEMKQDKMALRESIVASSWSTEPSCEGGRFSPPCSSPSSRSRTRRGTRSGSSANRCDPRWPGGRSSPESTRTSPTPRAVLGRGWSARAASPRRADAEAYASYPSTCPTPRRRDRSTRRAMPSPHAVSFCAR